MSPWKSTEDSSTSTDPSQLIQAVPGHNEHGSQQSFKETGNTMENAMLPQNIFSFFCESEANPNLFGPIEQDFIIVENGGCG